MKINKKIKISIDNTIWRSSARSGFEGKFILYNMKNDKAGAGRGTYARTKPKFE